MSGNKLLDSPWPRGAPWNLNRAGSFGQWLMWMLPPRGQDKVVAVLQVFCDESGIHDGAPICSVAGWVASARNWDLFEQRWLTASGGVDFHSKEFFARAGGGLRVGPYKDFTDEDAADYLLRLLGAIEHSDIHAVGAVIDVRAFLALSEEDRRWLTGGTWNNKLQRFTTSGSPRKPYYLGFIDCLENAALSVKKHGLIIDFCFDQQNVLAPWALQFFQRTKAKDSSRLAKKLGTAIFKSKEGVGGLQAADMLAHALYRHFSNSPIPTEFRPITEAFSPLIRAGKVARYFEPELTRRANDARRRRRAG